MWFSRETFVETCGSRELIDIDQKGFEKWKNMSKEVTFRTENYVQILASWYLNIVAFALCFSGEATVCH